MWKDLKIRQSSAIYFRKYRIVWNIFKNKVNFLNEIMLASFM